MTRRAQLTVAVLLAGLARATPDVDAASPPVAAPARDPAQIFATTCGWCHHKGGREAGKGPQLMGTTLSDEQIAFRIRKGRQGFMPGYEGIFSEREIAGLVAYIRGLKAR
jgi:mono/diheme cytochrome c family protein